MAKLLVFLIIFYIFVSVSGNCKKNSLEQKFTRVERNLIVKTHNQFRKLLEQGKVDGQPRAQKMPRLKWDFRLAQAAQKIANTCEFKHKPVKDERWSVGQNLYQMSSTAFTQRLEIPEAINSWFKEHKFYKYPNYSKEAGHYSQVIWADTKYVGCGYVQYKTKGKFKYHKILVCNYGPAGNVLGYAPYKPWSKKKF